MRSSAFSAASVCPLVMSATSHDLPTTEGGGGAAACAASRQTMRRSGKKRCMGLPKKDRIIELARDDERLELQLELDALGDRARGLARGVRANVQAPEIAQ